MDITTVHQENNRDIGDIYIERLESIFLRDRRTERIAYNFQLGQDDAQLRPVVPGGRGPGGRGLCLPPSRGDVTLSTEETDHRQVQYSPPPSANGLPVNQQSV